MLAAVAYNHDWQQLDLRFRAGDIYCYRGVQCERWEGLLALGSKGTDVRQHILNYYPYQRIYSAALAAS